MIRLPETMQEIFDIVVEHLAKQKYRAGDHDENGNFSCKYKDSAGRKCAIGCLIPDDKYQETFEGRNIHELPLSYPINGTYFLNHLQFAHDHSHSGDRLVANLESVTEEYKLNPIAIRLITSWEGQEVTRKETECTKQSLQD